MKYILSFLLFLYTLSFNAQISYGGRPLPLEASDFRSSNISANTEIEYVDMPTFNFNKNYLPNGDYRSLCFAHKFFVELNEFNSGYTFFTEDYKVWRVAIRSKGAYSLNLFFSKFKIPEGAKVFIYTPDQSEILGSYTDKNNSQSNVFPVQPIDGDRLIVEYQEPLMADFKGELEIGEVNHDFLGVLRSITSGPGRPYEDCHSDVLCFAENIETAKGVVLIVVNGTELCSGSLVNNTKEDDTPYLLTATHCFDKAKWVDNVAHYEKGAESIICFFNYNSPVCKKDDGQFTQHFQGPAQMSVASSDLILLNQRHDITLVKLKELPPKEYQPQLLGWNADEDPEDGNYNCIHHPGGGVKKVSVFKDELMIATRPPYKEKGHWYVENWNEGISEGGSSGSPLLDKEKRIIGTLTSGSSHCKFHPKYTGKAGPDLYASIPVIWNERTALNTDKSLKEFLDPVNTGKLQIGAKDPYADNDTIFSRISNYTPLEPYEPHHSSNSSLFETGGDLNSNEFAEEFSIEGNSNVYGVFIANPPIKANYTIKNMDVKVRVYSGEDGPEKLLAETDFDYTSRRYDWNKEKWDAAYMDLSFATENFVKFETPVSVKEKFYVSYVEVGNINPGFAVINIENRAKKGSTGSSIWAKRESGWEKIDKIQNAPFASSLMISPYMISFSYIDVEPDVDSSNIAKLPLYAYQDDANVIVVSDEIIDRISVFSIMGEKIFSATVVENSSESAYYKRNMVSLDYSLFKKKGLFIIVTSSGNKTNSAKVIIR